MGDVTEPAAYVRVFAVVNLVKGRIHGVTRDIDQSAQWVRQIGTAHPDVLLAAIQCTDLIDITDLIAAAETRGYAQAVAHLGLPGQVVDLIASANSGPNPSRRQSATGLEVVPGVPAPKPAPPGIPPDFED